MGVGKRRHKSLPIIQVLASAVASFLMMGKWGVSAEDLSKLKRESSASADIQCSFDRDISRLKSLYPVSQITDYTPLPGAASNLVITGKIGSEAYLVMRQVEGRPIVSLSFAIQRPTVLRATYPARQAGDAGRDRAAQ